ncbi:uncharacterized protein LOC115220522 isoform X1 [Octopus sinensis]|uniref:Uncharacterized protein LOC115220522 isoform X1 n=1 Tax=Octopus sinensis TaxID=2607531 RepID=A0A6P7T810_9MOLL|nr:uncharacterized protein LOC115220522 isoform X1 [Octopus sinensis]
MRGYIICFLIFLDLPYTSSAEKSYTESQLMKYRSRDHAWENFFMSWETCSHIDDFKKKLAYSHMIIMDAMDKVWDEPYIKRLLLFPIYHFKQYETNTFKKAMGCFQNTFADPFTLAIAKESKRRKRSVRSKRNIASLGKAALNLQSGSFSGFLLNTVSEGLLGILGIGDNAGSSSNATQSQDVNEWRDMEVTNDDITVLLLEDLRFLRSFKFVIHDFEKYVLNCLDKDRKMTIAEHKFCNIKSKSLDKRDHESNPGPESGAIAKISRTFSFTALVIYTLFLVCTFY